MATKYFVALIIIDQSNHKKIFLEKRYLHYFCSYVRYIYFSLLYLTKYCGNDFRKAWKVPIS